MKAVVFERHGGVEVLEYRDDLPIPQIGPNDVLLNIKATTMNYNCIWARKGLPGMDFLLPHINGTDASGVVVDIGSEVKHVKVGDEVLVLGAFSCMQCEHCASGWPMFCPDYRIWGFQTGPLDGAEAEYGRVPAVNVVPKPSNVGHEGAAAIGAVLATAWRMLVTRARMQSGDWVMVWGASGGLGTVAIQLCKAFNAKVIAIAGSDAKCQLAADLGADHVINRNKQRIAREVMKITGKRGVDIVFEHSGAETWETSQQCLKWGGTIVTCGATTGFKATMDIRFLWNKQQTYLGSHYATMAELKESLLCVERGQIKPVLHEVISLKDVARGHEILESGEVLGKIVLIPG